MAFNNGQEEQPLPGSGNEKRKSSQHLPKYFRTQFNNKFLSSTLDQLIQPGVAEKLNGYYGRKTAKGFVPSDYYVGDISADRENYQFEPAAVIKDELGNVNFYGTYNDYINQIRNLDGNVNDHSLLNRQEYYAWQPHINWDKFVNFREYYWLPNGPQGVPVAGETIDVVSTYKVTSNDSVDNKVFVIDPDGFTNNPELTLYRGITYRFEIDSPGLPFSIRTARRIAPEWRAVSFYKKGEQVLYKGGIYIANSDIATEWNFEDHIDAWDLDTTFNLKDQVSEQGVEKGTIEVTLDGATPDAIYYVSDGDINAGGLIRVYDIDEATSIDVEQEIIGKKFYKTSGNFDLTNGMKIYFTGDVTPERYATGQWYVEGVGESIQLIAEDELNVASAFTDDFDVNFDSEGFDRLPYSQAIGYPAEKDYLTIDRTSKDGNLWSKYNRWFHKTVIETSAAINNQPSELDQTARATRPIIEFEPGLKLFDFGTSVKQNIDLIDDFTADVFSTIEGSTGYNVDGVDLTNGMRVLFTGDKDTLVNGKIYEVKFITLVNTRQITLQETEDTTPLENENVLCKGGETYKGKMLYYNGTEWKLTQDKINTNQSPLFDLYDKDGVSIVDEDVYESSTFVGTKIFSYKQGVGANDTELGFPLSYRSIQNVGDITFNFDLITDVINYVKDSEEVTLSTAITYLRKYSSLTDFTYLNGWLKADTLSSQPVIRQFVVDNSLITYPIDVYDRSGLLTDLTVKVILNNQIQFEGKDYELTVDGQDIKQINFLKTLDIDDVIIVKTRSSAAKNNNGIYEIANSLERNPLNRDMQDFTLGEVNDHVGSIIEELNDFDGRFPGISNLRDLGSVSQYGKRFVKHSSPINLAMYHLLDKESNIVKSLKYARREYGKFKRTFLQKAFDLGFSGPVKQHVDKILVELNKDKTSTMPFYFSDMVPAGAAVSNTITIDDVEDQFFALTKVFTLDELSDGAVQVYQNDIQLVHGADYTFNDQGFVIVTAQKQRGDTITVYEYETTNGSYVPPTPTKLGLYPKYIPQKYIDDTYREPQEVIQGHDGSVVFAYGDFRDDLLLELEKRIFNNIKVEYDKELFDLTNFVPSEGRNTVLSVQTINDTMLSDFVQWLQLVDEDYTSNSGYQRSEPFTFNHQGMSDASGNPVTGYWRAVYTWAYDTDRPHTHPWEMLGFTIKPTWWDEQYGEAPYTSNNLLLWEDLEAGIIREPNKPAAIKDEYKRPQLVSHLPVDEDGNLVSPVNSGYIINYDTTGLGVDFVYGDHSPVETAWRRSSEYPFALLTSLFVNQPNNVLATAWDRQRQTRNIAGQLVYNNSTQMRIEDLQFPNTINSDTRTYTSGLVNYVYDYMTSSVTTSYMDYVEEVKQIDNRMSFRIGGFSTKDKFKLILDSRTPLNQGNVFVPEENYQIFLNTSTPVKTINYSGVIIEKQSYGFVVRGYNTQQPYFYYNAPFNLDNDPLVNVGGISQSFLLWDERKTYAVGQVVENENSYYRVTEAHTSSTEFDQSKFAKIPAIPLVGGREAYFRSTFSKTPTKVPYGTTFETIQEVVDFVVGYQDYLEEQGFVFDYYNTEEQFVSDWATSAKEFMFWTTQNWGDGAVITISPAADQLKFISEYAVVDDVFDTFYGYSLFKADGKKLQPEFASLTRENSGEFILSPKNTDDGIFAAKLALVQKEHAVLIDNTTVFGDIIFDQEPGYRQERIKVLGYRTGDWDGSLNIPGFIFDNAQITEWKSWKDYAIGDLVKYKEFFYSAKNKVPGTEIFNASDWVRLSEKPEMGLIPNFEYKTNQFADFYDLDTDNFDLEQQKFAQHLIGYQNRDYLANIINDDVSQYKFYQGMIQEKGTRNALSKLFDVLSSADKDSLDFYEEWAVKAGQYGAADGFDEVEYLLDEANMRLSPQPIELVNTITGTETDLVYRIRPFETYLQPDGYTHAPFPQKYVDDTYVKNSGYVNQDDVDFIVSTYDSILNINYATCKFDDLIWVGNDKLTWNVYAHIRTDYIIDAINENGKLEFNSTDFDFAVGDIIGITETNFAEGFYKVTEILGNTVTINKEGLEATEEPIAGRVSKLINVHVTDLESANELVQQIPEGITKLWVDQSENDKWAVLQQVSSFTEQDVVANDIGEENSNYGIAIASNTSNNVLIVGAPDDENGKVYVYTRSGGAGKFALSNVIEPIENQADDNERFGASVALSADGEYLAVGSPDASNVRTTYQEEYVSTQDYALGDIVKYQNNLWKALVAIEGAEANIQFGSNESVPEILVALGLKESFDTKIPVLLTGNYPYQNINNVDHIIVKAPADMYEGSGVNDTLRLKWNLITNANQDVDKYTEVQPFDGEYGLIDNEYLTGNFTISAKIDSILFVPGVTTVPLVGQTVEVAGGFGTVNFVYEDEDQGSATIYVSNQNGTFGTQGSLATSIGEFIGEYETVAPVDDYVGDEIYWGGYWKLDLGTTYNVTTITEDEGRGLAYVDIVPNGATNPNRQWFSIYDIKTSDAVATNPTYSNDVRFSELTKLSYDGQPGPGGAVGEVLDNRFVVRAPSALTDGLTVIAAGDGGNPQVNLFYNPLARFELEEWQPNTVYRPGDILRYVSAEYSNIYWRVTARHTSEESFLQFNLLTDDPADVTYNIDNYVPLDGLPFDDPADIGLNLSDLNKQHTIYDVWDGYLDFNITKTLDDVPIEPKVGIIVKDVTNKGEALVTHYQRTGISSGRIYVKNVSGVWAAGALSGENREIEFLADGSGDPIYDPSSGARIFGQIQSRAFELAAFGIGKMIVLTRTANVPVTNTQTILEGEYFLYQEELVDGIARPANIPAESNNDWQTMFNLPVQAGATASGLTQEGYYTVYGRTGVGQYTNLGAFSSNLRQSGSRLGEDVQFAKNANLYKLFVKEQGNGTLTNNGRIYIINNGTEGEYQYGWELSTDKKYKGAYDNTRTYTQDDVVFFNGRLYQAITNMGAGVFNANNWTEIEDPRDYTGYIPNDTGLTISGNTLLDQSDMTAFAKSFDVSSNGEVVVASVINQSNPNVVTVYRNDGGLFYKDQEIVAPNNLNGFGDKVSISPDGLLIAISEPFNDSIEIDAGKVYVYKQVRNGLDVSFELSQELRSPDATTAEMFGVDIDFDGSTLVVGCRNGDGFVETSFDQFSDGTTFDAEFTKFRTVNENAGHVKIFERIGNTLVYGQTIDFDDSGVKFFGRNITLNNGHVYAGLPSLPYSGSREGTVVDFRRSQGSIWNNLRQGKTSVDIEKIKRVMLYDTKTNELIQYLDYVDVLQGKVPGVAEQELSFKTYYDPATYTFASNGNTLDPTNSWGPEHVGELWWDLSNAKFLNPYQDSIIYSANKWNTAFSEINSIDVYEWVESKFLPSEWDVKSGKGSATTAGITGTSLYGDDSYSTKRVYDEATKTFTVYYYFWVANKTTVPEIEGRNLSASAVSRLIADPAGQGYRFVSFISPTQVALHNCESLVRGKDVAFSVQYWTIDNQEQNIHNQYQILSDGLATSKPSADIERKWFDSLIGYDTNNRPVPAPELSVKEKYGILNRPRQSWFVNRIEAYKQFIERVNSTLIKNLIVDEKDISRLTESEQPPLLSSNTYDRTVERFSDLEFVGVAKARQAVLTPIIEDGVIVRVEITDSGRGYLRSPTVEIFGPGQDAAVETTINNQGSITSVTVINGGKYYDNNTRLTVRKYTVLVEADETLADRWALYERDIVNNTWIRISSQSYNVDNYWYYTDWYADGYNQFTQIDQVIDFSFELQGLDNAFGDIVKINNIGSGGWLLLEKIDSQQGVDYTVNYKTIGRQNGTLQFADALYDTTKNLVGYDTTSFDVTRFDGIPSTESRIVLETIRNQIFTDDLEVEYNKLFFASLRYVFAEQSSVDWAFKTSFIKAKHNVGNLEQKVNFQNDNLASYEEYIKEVKPYKSKIREYLSSYENIDNSQSMISDFDLSPRYITDNDEITPQRIKVIDSRLVNTDADIDIYPYKNWADNVGFEVSKINISNPGKGYIVAPQVTISGGGGSGAKAVAAVGLGGAITSITITDPGKGYLTTPTVTLNGSFGQGEPAKVEAVIDNTVVRTMSTAIKFDRVSGNYEFINLLTTETFVGTGAKNEFILKWPMNLRTDRVMVTVDGDEVLGGNYSYENVADTSKGYDREYGKITFNDSPASDAVIVIEYYKDIKLLKAQDRINLAYAPTADQFGKTLGQLMDGVDYGGVQVRSFEFGGQNGWDNGVWMDEAWDVFDTTYEDYTVTLDGSTNEFDLTDAIGQPKPLEEGIIYNVYKNGTRIDDPNYGTPDQTNNDALMLPIVGNGTQTTININDYDITGNDGDTFIIRKITSDGAFLPDPDVYDTALSGGDLQYTTATGLNSADITVDGDGFVTPTTSKGPEEVVPGQVLDTLDIKVYERPTVGSSEIESRNYVGDGVTRTFDIGASPVKRENLFVKVGYSIVNMEDYLINYNGKTLTFDTAPNAGDRINIINVGMSASNILDIDTYSGNGTTVEFLSNARYQEGAEAFATVNGKVVDVSLIEADNSYEYPGNFIVKFPTPPFNTANVKVLIAEAGLTNEGYSQVTIDTIVADGSTTNFTLSQAPFEAEPLRTNMLVKVNDKVLHAGYTQTFDVTNIREYQFDLTQIPIASINAADIEVYLNGRRLEYLQEWTYEGAGSFDSTLPQIQQAGSTVKLELGIGDPGDVLDVYVISDAEYNLGYFDGNGDFVRTPDTLYLTNAYNENDVITVYQFSNHDSQGLERQKIQITEKTDIPVGTAQYYEFRRFQRGLFDLRTPALSVEFVWVIRNGILLTPSVNYSLTPNKLSIQLLETPQDDDVIELLHFANGRVVDQFGWRQFKDILNRTHYKRLEQSYELAEDLNYYDKIIKVADASGLPAPEYNAKYPGVIFIQGERIEYFTKDGNELKQLRRGTLGTGVKDVYEEGTIFVAQDVDKNIPYKDEEQVVTVTSDGYNIAAQTYENSAGVTIEKFTYDFNNNTAFPLGGQLTTITGTGFETNARVHVGDTLPTVTLPANDIVNTTYIKVKPPFYFQPNSWNKTLINGKVVQFTGTPFGGLAADTDYYIVDVVAATTLDTDAAANEVAIAVSTTEGGAAEVLTPGNGTMDIVYDSSTYINDTEVLFITPVKPVGSYDLVVVNPATSIPIDRAQTSVVVPGGVIYVQILLPYAPIPNPATATGWYKDQQEISVSDVVPGRGYVIASQGTTDFTQYGATNNLVGTEFIITGVPEGTGTVLDFTSIPLEYWEAQDIEVFEAGRRLRKTPIAVYSYLDQDSPEGDVMVEAEFAVNKNVGAYVRLTTPPPAGTQVTIVKKIGTLWTEPGTALSKSENDIAKFLQAKTTELPR